MKKKITSTLWVLTTLLFISCEKDNVENNVENIEYYVEYQAKYTVNGGNYTTNSTTINYNTPNGSKTTTINNGQSYSVTVGPFKRGDRTYIVGNAPTGVWGHSAYSSISVKKGDTPFVQKAESSTSLSCSYTIDF